MTTTELNGLEGTKTWHPIRDFISWIEQIDERCSWVTCYLCKDEWSKLRPCVFYDGMKEVVTHLCIQCAENVRGLERVAPMYPIQKPFDNWPEDWIATFYFQRFNRFYIKAWAGARKGESDLTWFFYRDGIGLVLFDYKAGEHLASYNNTVEAWHGARIRIGQFFAKQEKAKQIEADTWGSTSKRPGGLPRLLAILAVLGLAGPARFARSDRNRPESGRSPTRTDSLRQTQQIES